MESQHFCRGRVDGFHVHDFVFARVEVALYADVLLITSITRLLLILHRIIHISVGFTSAWLAVLAGAASRTTGPFIYQNLR